jgi:hypothetical protein
MSDEDPPLQTRRRRWPVVLLALAGVVVLALLAAWFSRDRIAGSVIAGQLESLGVPARYEIESVGPRRQVLTHVVVGDPAHPDLTIERVETELSLGLGAPAIGRVTVVRPRLYGSYREGKLSFDSLDKALFGGVRKEPFRLPDMIVTVIDGRARLVSDFGPVGIKLDGKGPLRGGFAGTLAAVAPRLEGQGCRAERASLYGAIGIRNEKPRFVGPIRLGALNCGTALAGQSAAQLDAVFDLAQGSATGEAKLRSEGLGYADSRAARAGGTLRFSWHGQALTARYDLSGQGLANPQAAAASIKAAGVLRRSAGRIEVEGEVSGEGIRPGSELDAALAGVQRGAEGTLAAPLIAQLRGALLREGPGSRLSATHMLRLAGDTTSLVVPQAALRGGSGATLLSLSRFQLTRDGAGPPRLAGNFATGGPGVPQIAGRLERPPGGRLITRMTLADYHAGDARLALPRLTLVQLPDGALGFSGEARLSGALPGGRAENLVLPLEGSWAAARGLQVWRRCATVRFDRLTLAELSFDRRSLALCPPKGGAILVADARGARLAAGAPALDLSGKLGATPIRIRSGAVGLAWPGSLSARALEVTLGSPETASSFRISGLAAQIGRDVAGTFAGTDVRLAAVPLDLLDATGTWRYAGGKLTLGDAAFRLEDRAIDDRFQPLVARGGTLALADNVITAEAMLREPTSDREIVRATIRHDLSAARGSADLAVAGITFDDRLQPDTISRLAIGVVANAQGTVSGSGRIDWTASDVTSSGRFTTPSLDFAAAFGPVKGAAGTIVFTDLLGLVSAPDQQLRIASINPGIEVNDGVLTYALRPESVLAVKGATWPFLDGTLTLLPVTMRLGVAEERRYTLKIQGMDAARFIQRLELANLSATGVFDGSLPLVFDQEGGRIEGGELRSRPPGGNVSYVGELTYKDLSTMANFAFDALKSLDYRDMAISMDGPLQGEIITRVQFAGIGQGAAARRNFVTERISRLPIRFNVNVRAPFFQLASTFRSLYDPTYIRDPRSLGLIDANGRPIRNPTVQPAESAKAP